MGDEPDGDDEKQEKVSFSITLPKNDTDQLLADSPAALDYQGEAGNRDATANRRRCQSHHRTRTKGVSASP
ncbi:hypothetical protein Natpe_1810 [Natrinema pellirubrum DSM 15624]|uniref:Uncharacterized protein n=1 Tax=Natrinema pellirubrum (strain DSM 15624 / CIP 106293 / JCM 10476 / NCIMB 786 / 157) TaxID=797303 RepID=L0JJH9_NATP1|nr:hypothetical protein [Natrinema pellirubrum]AGB31690.1 hypothetical protein Natpe_1810 [Natrinema pellirubrum DSM 15624]